MELEKQTGIIQFMVALLLLRKKREKVLRFSMTLLKQHDIFHIEIITLSNHKEMIVLISLPALRPLSNEVLTVLKSVFSEDVAGPDMNGFFSSKHVSSSHLRVTYIINRKTMEQGQFVFFLFFFFLHGYWGLVINFIFSIALNW